MPSSGDSGAAPPSPRRRRRRRSPARRRRSRPARPASRRRRPRRPAPRRGRGRRATCVFLLFVVVARLFCARERDPGSREDFFHTPKIHAHAQRSGSAGCRLRGASSASCRIRSSNSKFCSVSSACAVWQSWTSWTLVARCPKTVCRSGPALITADNVMRVRRAIAAQRFCLRDTGPRAMGLWTNGRQLRVPRSRCASVASPRQVDGVEKPPGNTARTYRAGPAEPRAPLD